MVPHVLVADDQPEVRFALELLLKQECSGPVVVDQAAEADEALGAAWAHLPALVLLDWDLPDRRPDAKPSGETLVIGMRQLAPSARIVVLSTRPEARERALAAGADHFVSKADAPDALLAAIRACLVVSVPPEVRG